MKTYNLESMTISKVINVKLKNVCFSLLDQIRNETHQKLISVILEYSVTNISIKTQIAYSSIYIVKTGSTACLTNITATRGQCYTAGHRTSTQIQLVTRL